jgi:hypothetical protein
LKFRNYVIPGRAKREPGIHNHSRALLQRTGQPAVKIIAVCGYGFRARAKRRVPE